MPRVSRRSALVLVGLAVSLVFTYIAVRDVEFGVFWDGLRTSNYWLLIPAFALLAATVFIRGLRWWSLFAADQRPAIGPLMEALLIGYLFNNILPVRAGEAARVVALHQRTGTSRATTLGTAVSERVYDVLALLMILFVSTPFLPEVTWLRTAIVFAAAVVGLLVATIAALLIWGDLPARLLFRPVAYLPWVSRARADLAAENLVHGLAGFTRASLAVPAFVLTVVSWLVLALSYWVLMGSFDLALGFDAALLAVVATNLALVLPSSPAAIGVFEAATQVALGAFGIGESRALSYAVVLHALNFFPYIGAGYLVLQRHSAALREREPRQPGTASRSHMTGSRSSS